VAVACLRVYLPEFGLALAAALYGSTFILVQNSLDHAGEVTRRSPA